MHTAYAIICRQPLPLSCCYMRVILKIHMLSIGVRYLECILHVAAATCLAQPHPLLEPYIHGNHCLRKYYYYMGILYH